MTMKAKLHIPTEQYGFVEVEIDSTGEEAVDLYTKLSAYSKGGEGLEEKQFNAFIDTQLIGGSNHIEEYNQMTPSQQNIVQTIKRALKRIDYNQKKV